MKDKRPYYKTCPECGAHLDPGERCDCIAGAPPVKTTQTIHKGGYTHEGKSQN